MQAEVIKITEIRLQIMINSFYPRGFNPENLSLNQNLISTILIKINKANLTSRVSATTTVSFILTVSILSGVGVTHIRM